VGTGPDVRTYCIDDVLDFSYWSDAPLNGIELRMANRRAILRSDKRYLTAVFVAFPIREFDQIRPIPKPACSRVGVFRTSRSPSGGRRERDDVRHRRRPELSPQAITVQAGRCWPTRVPTRIQMLALGVCHALRDAKLLAELVDAGPSGAPAARRCPERLRNPTNAATLVDYHENLQMARLEPPPPDVLAMRLALRNRPDESKLFALAAFDSDPARSVLNPTICARSWSQQPAPRNGASSQRRENSALSSVPHAVVQRASARRVREMAAARRRIRACCCADVPIDTCALTIGGPGDHVERPGVYCGLVAQTCQYLGCGIVS